MKTIRITLEKPGAQATCTHRYHFDDFPEDTTWAGNRAAFKSPEGGDMSFTDGVDNLERVVAHQAAICAATYKIEDLGGEAITWTDDVILPSAPMTHDP